MIVVYRKMRHRSGKIFNRPFSIIDMTGKRFSNLVVLGLDKKRTDDIYWRCKCDCGKIAVKRGSSLRRGDTTSCGCVQRRVSTSNCLAYVERKRLPYVHKKKLGDIRQAMRKRCYNKSDKFYKNYGGRGITVCKEWLDSTIAFYEWAEYSGYRPGLYLDRIDNDGGYSPDNCRWVTCTENCNNSSINVWYTWNGQTRTVRQWSDVTGIGYRTIMGRLQRGWDLERTFTSPLKVNQFD